MEYDKFTLKLKVPRPRLSWFRYRVRTLLLLMLLIAIGATLWSHRVAGTEQRLMRQLRQSQAERDAALQQWKRAMSVLRQGGNVAQREAEARAKYFKHRSEIDDLLRQLAAESG